MGIKHLKILQTGVYAWILYEFDYRKGIDEAVPVRRSITVLYLPPLDMKSSNQNP